MAKPSTWTRIEGEVRGEYRGRSGYNVIERYSTPLGTTFAAVEAAFPRWSAYGGQTGTFKPLLEDYTVEDARAPDARDLVTLYWLAPTWRGILERNPNKARLLAAVNEVAVRPDYDLDGEAVWAEKWVEDGAVWKAIRFRPISGSGLQHHARTLLRLQVVATQGILGSILALHDTVNAAATTFGAGPGTLRMAGANTETVMSDEPLTFLDAVMEFNKKRWNEDTEVQAFEYRVHKVQVYDTDGTAVTGTGSTRDVGDWYPRTGPGNKRIARLHESVGWGGLDKQIVWT